MSVESLRSELQSSAALLAINPYNYRVVTQTRRVVPAFIDHCLAIEKGNPGLGAKSCTALLDAALQGLPLRLTDLAHRVAIAHLSTKLPPMLVDFEASSSDGSETVEMPCKPV